MNIPFLGGGPSISEQILQGLHEGFQEKQAKQEFALKQKSAQSDIARNDILNVLTQAQTKHAAVQTAYEEETDPVRKQQLLTDLHKSQIDLATKKHTAKFFGVDLDNLDKAANEAANPPPKEGEQTPLSGFQKEIQNTKKFLGTMTPDEEAIFNNAANVATRTLDATPVTSALAHITQQRATTSRAELETTPFKSWQAKFTREHGREPNSKEIEAFQLAPTQLRMTGMENLRQDNYLDTTQPGGQIIGMTSGEFADANKAEPGRFVKSTPTVANAVKASGLISDIRDGMKQMQDAVKALPEKGLSSEGRALLSLAAKHPETATQTVMAGLAASKLSEAEQDYLIAHATLAERAMALRGLQGAGAGSDQQRAAITAMLPGFATADAKMAGKQLKTLANNVDNVERTIPKVGKMSRESAGEAAAGKKPEETPKATHRYNPATGQIEELP